jgi:hypothetical protein
LGTSSSSLYAGRPRYSPLSIHPGNCSRTTLAFLTSLATSFPVFAEVPDGTVPTPVESGFERIPAALRAEVYRTHEEDCAAPMKSIEQYLAKAA